MAAYQLLKDPSVAGPGMRINTEGVTANVADFFPQRAPGIPADTAWDIVQWGQDGLINPTAYSSGDPATWDPVLGTSASFSFVNPQGNARLNEWNTDKGWVYGLGESAGPGTSTAEHDLFLSAASLGSGISLSNQVDLSLQARLSQVSIQPLPDIGGGIYATAFTSFTANFSAPGQTSFGLFIQIPITSSQASYSGLGYFDVTGDANYKTAIVNYLEPGQVTIPFSPGGGFQTLSYNVNSYVEDAATAIFNTGGAGVEIKNLSNWTLGGSYIGWTAQDGGIYNQSSGGTSSEELQLSNVVLSDSSAAALAQLTSQIPSAVPAPPAVKPILLNQHDDVRIQSSQGFSFALPQGSFSDPNGGSIAYTASLPDGSALPSWVSFVPSTLTFSGTTLAGTNVTTLMISAVSSEGTVADEAFKIYSAPATPGLREQRDDFRSGGNTRFSFSLPAVSFVDPQGGNVSYMATSNDGSPLPGWVTFDPVKGVFTGTTPSDRTDLGIKLTATTSEGGVAAEAFRIYVTPSTPTLSFQAQDQRLSSGQALSYTLPANSFSNSDGGPVSYSVTGVDGATLAPWITFDAVTKTISGIIPAGNVADAIEIVATTRGGIAAEAFHVYGTPPAPIFLSQKGDERLQAGQAFSFRVPTGSFASVSGITPTLSARFDDLSPLRPWISFDASTGTFSGITPGGVGGAGIRIDASVPGGAISAEAFHVYWMPTTTP